LASRRALRNSRGIQQAHSVEVEAAEEEEEEALLEARTVKICVATKGEAEAIRNTGAGAAEGREMVRVTVEDMLQIKAKRLSETQKNTLNLYQQSPRSFYHKMTTKTQTPKSASFAPRQFSTPPSLLATTVHVIFAPSECELYTRPKLAPIVEQNPTTLFSQMTPRRTTNTSRLPTSSRRMIAWAYISRIHKFSKTRACYCNTIVQKLIAMLPVWAGLIFIVM
jgi:sulfite reductase alpha subunit-like flavoprotein